MGLDEDALGYHREDPPGKLEISTTKPTNTQRDLSLAYSPGVAAPCREIRDDTEEAEGRVRVDREAPGTSDP